MTNLPQLAASPAAFCDAVLVRTAKGLERFGTVKTPAQHELIEATAPAALAIVGGTIAPVRRVWAEMTKGYAKTTIVAMLVLYMLAFARRALRVQIGARDRDQAGEVRLAAQEILAPLPW